MSPRCKMRLCQFFTFKVIIFLGNFHKRELTSTISEKNFVKCVYAASVRSQNESMKINDKLDAGIICISISRDTILMLLLMFLLKVDNLKTQPRNAKPLTLSRVSDCSVRYLSNIFVIYFIFVCFESTLNRRN